MEKLRRSILSKLEMFYNENLDLVSYVQITRYTTSFSKEDRIVRVLYMWPNGLLILRPIMYLGKASKKSEEGKRSIRIYLQESPPTVSTQKISGDDGTIKENSHFQTKGYVKQQLH